MQKMSQYMHRTNLTIKNHLASFKNLETQIGQLTSILWEWTLRELFLPIKFQIQGGESQCHFIKEKCIRPSHQLKQYVDFKIMEDKRSLAIRGFSDLYEFLNQAQEESMAPKFFVEMTCSSNVILIFRCVVGGVICGLNQYSIEGYKWVVNFWEHDNPITQNPTTILPFPDLQIYVIYNLTYIHIPSNILNPIAFLK